MFDASQTLISTVTIVTAAVGNPNFRGGSAEISELLTSTHKQLDEMSRPRDASADLQLPLSYEPAVTVRKSLASPDHIISMIDGKPYKTLRRHLATHGLTPDDYRARYGLKADYPMVAPSYSEKRSQMAKQLGLGTKPNRTGAEA